jgi:hypothetical protein
VIDHGVGADARGPGESTGLVVVDEDERPRRELRGVLDGLDLEAEAVQDASASRSRTVRNARFSW